MMPKKVSSQSLIGQQGANLVERIVLQMKYIWRQKVVFDLGVDGEIEICDPISGAATNSLINVQVKATTRPFQCETPESFEFTCDPRDIEYWLRGNVPVILIVCRPETNEAYWKSIKDYFQNPKFLKNRKIQFNKKMDCFNPKCYQMLSSIAIPKDTGLYFSPLNIEDLLYTNLLPVSFDDKIYLAYTEYIEPKLLTNYLKSNGLNDFSEWVFPSKQQILSFYDLNNNPFDKICDRGTCECFDTSEWAETNDEDRKRDFVRLLNFCLQKKAKSLGLWYDKASDVHFFKSTSDLKTQRVHYKSIKQQTSCEVFKRYVKHRGDKTSEYCRHAAFKGFFKRFEGQWYLEITPTYYFTWNGQDKDKFGESRLQGIKRLERNPAVLGKLLMWADIFTRPNNILSLEYSFLHFGEIKTIEFNTNLPDALWSNNEEGVEEKALQYEDNQLTLLGL
jgi:hypothetical protein